MKTFTLKSLIPITWGDAEIRRFLPGLTLIGLEVSGHTAVITIKEDITNAAADALVNSVKQYVLANLITRSS